MTVQQVIDIAKLGMEEISEPKGLIYYNRTARQILARSRLRSAEIDIQIADGTREYDLPADVLKVWRVAYHESATSEPWPLDAVSEDQLDAKKTWRNLPSGSGEGIPDYYYLRHEAVAGSDAGTRQKIGFDLIPGTDYDASSGYPVVKVHYSAWTDAQGVGDDVPASFGGGEALAAGIRYLYARDRMDPAASQLLVAFVEEVNELVFQKTEAAHETRSFQLPAYLEDERDR